MQVEVRLKKLEKNETIHPDRFAHDPQAERRAAEEARAVNQAYQELSNC